MVCAGFLRNPSPVDAMSYKQKTKSRLRINSCVISFFVCDPCRIQTCNPHIRSVVLYSVELTDHCFSKAGAKVLLFFDMTKYFGKKMQNNLILLLFVVQNEQNGLFPQYIQRWEVTPFLIKI